VSSGDEDRISSICAAVKHYARWDSDGGEAKNTPAEDFARESGTDRPCCRSWLTIYFSYFMVPFDFLLSFDHRTELRQNILRAHGGEKTKEIFSRSVITGLLRSG